MMMKLMMATALVTATLVGSFMESAQAGSLRGEGEEATGSRYNEVEVNYEFKLFTIKPTGEFRSDEDSRNNVGKFTGAIEEFKGRIFDVDDLFEYFEKVNITDKFSPRVDGIIQEHIYFLNPATLDLTAKFIKQEENILLPDESIADNFWYETEGWVKNFKAPKDRIEYTVTGSELKEKGIIELTVIIDDLNSIIKPPNTVNSIEDIIKQDLLGKANKIRISGIGSKNSPAKGKIVSNERSVSKVGENNQFPPPTVKRLPPRVVVLPDNSTTKVPESSTNNSLLTLGALGVGVLLKRTVK